MEEIFSGVAEVAKARGWTLDSGMRWRRSSGSPIVAGDVAGIIVQTGGDAELAAAVLRAGVPVVDLDECGDLYGAPKVTIPDESIGVAAAAHLAAGMPDRLIFVRHSHFDSPVQQARLRGFLRGAESAGLPAETLREAEFDPASVASGGAAGVFCPVDPLAMRIIDRCVEAGVPVPGKIAVLGCDDFAPSCEMARVPLSSVNPGFREKGRVAAELLARLMAGEPVPKKPVVLPVAGVSERASTRRIDTGHPKLDALVLHFLKNAGSGADVAGLCEACDVPKRTATNLVRAGYGLTPMELLDECRLVLARRFEARGTLGRKGVAASSGFGRVAALERAERDSRARPPIAW